MPLENGKYVAPEFVNDTAPALSADEMNAMAGAVAGAVEFDRALELSNEQKTQAVNNIGALSKQSQTLSSAEKSNVLSNVGAVSYNSQSLTAAQKFQAVTNIGAVTFASAQGLTAAQKTQVKANIGAVGASGVAVSVAKTAWNGSSAPYTASVTVNGVTASNNIVVGIGSVTAAQYAAFVDAQIACTAQSANKITLTAFGDKPTIALPISVVILS